MVTRIVLVRHGQTDWNAERRVQGHSDVPLNQVGRDQAVALARLLDGRRFDAAYSSDLSRAVETARIAVDGQHRLVRTAALREKHFGTWEGLTDAEVLERFPEASAGSWGDAETTDELASRVLRVLQEIAHAHVGETVLVVTHGGPIRAVLRACGAEPAAIENCSIVEIEVREGELRRVD